MKVQADPPQRAPLADRPFVPNIRTIRAMREAQCGECKQFDAVAAMLADATLDDEEEPDMASFLLRDAVTGPALELSEVNEIPDGAAARVRLVASGLQADWSVRLVQIQDTIAQIDGMYETLSGEAHISDDDSLSIRLIVDVIGHVKAAVYIRTAGFSQVNGSIEFEVNIDQTHLPELSAALSQLTQRKSPHVVRRG